MVARLYEYEIPTKIPKYPLRKGLILQWNEGWGEIAPLPGFNRESLEEARTEILFHLPHLAAAKPLLPSVRFGLDCASRPFSFEPIRIAIAELNRPPSSLFRTMKLKLGHLSVDDAVSLVKKYKGFRLRLDFNRSWTLDQALLFASHFKPDDFEYLEEPVQTIEDLVYFSQNAQFPIAVDESLCSLANLPTLKARVIKPTVLGGIPASLPAVDTVLSSSYETGLGLLHIARLSRNFATIPGLDTAHLLDQEILTPPLAVSDGVLYWKPNIHSPIDVSKLCLIASAP